MDILALETSCDETAAAVVTDGRHVRSSIISSQADFHARYGGVIPELAARQHADMVPYVIEDALRQADRTIDDIDAIAATLGPGLVGALLVGANAGRTLSLVTGKPFLGVNHLYAHVASNYLDSNLEPPFLCLLISGGHTQILHVEAYDKLHILGDTLDDAVGEAYDKVARLLGLPYPGGPELDRLAQSGDPLAFTLPQAKTVGGYDFSYSGLKTAALRHIEKQTPAPDSEPQPAWVADLAASFQHVATEVLVTKTILAARNLGLSTIAIAGGVAANSAVRRKFEQAVKLLPNGRLYVPNMAYCTDNAAMVGASAFFNPISHDLADDVFSRGSHKQAARP